MGTLTKTFIVLNLVFSVAFVAVTATVLSQRTNYKLMKEKLQDDYDGLQRKMAREKTDYEATKASLLEARNVAQQQARDMEEKVRNLQQNLSKADLTVVDLTKRMGEALAVSDRLSQDVKALAEARQTAEGNLETARKELAAAVGKADALNTTLVYEKGQRSALELRYKDLLDRFNVTTEECDGYKKSVAALEAIVPDAVARVRQDVIAAPPAPIHATVKAVSMDTGLVVLNAGSENAPPVKKGYRFLIHRDQTFIAAVRVTNVEKNMCATEIVPPLPDTKVAIQVGDEAVTEY